MNVQHKVLLFQNGSPFSASNLSRSQNMSAVAVGFIAALLNLEISFCKRSSTEKNWVLKLQSSKLFHKNCYMFQKQQW